MSTATPTCSIRGEHADQRVLDRVVQVGHPLASRRLDRLGDVVHRERVAGCALGVADARAIEVELAGGGRRPGRRELRVTGDQVGELVAGLGRVDQVGGNRRVELQPDR